MMMAKKPKVDQSYRECFSTPAGRRVLASLLLEAKFMDYTHTPEEQAVENFVKTILYKTGSYNQKNLDSYVLNLLNLPMRIENG